MVQNMELKNLVTQYNYNINFQTWTMVRYSEKRVFSAELGMCADLFCANAPKTHN